MKVNIYYFSGTGNSLYIAKKIEERTKGELISIASMVHTKEIRIIDDVVGIIFPIYYANLPNIITIFAHKLKQIESEYIFAVCTYGGGKGEAINHLKSIMNPKKISAVYGIHMPQNAFFKFWENHTKLNKAADAMVKLICNNIKEKRKGFFSSNMVIDILQRPLYPLLRPLIIKSLAKMSKVQDKKPLEELIYLADKHFKTNERCSGCGICVKVCPVNNIILVNKKPQWLHRCENCLACYNFCPEKAIDTDLVTKNYHYRHSKIALSDIMKQNHPFFKESE